MSSVQTHVDLARIRANAEKIIADTGVELIGVVKADAYGHGAVSVADTINDLASQWYVFSPFEAVRARLFDLTGKVTIAGCVKPDTDVDMLREQGVRPAVWTPEAARHFAPLDPLLSVDTGMQRFACPPDQLPAMFEAYEFREAMTHTARPEGAIRLRELMADGKGLKLHAAGTSLLGDERCWFDAVRPGLALYAGAARVTAHLIDARDEQGPVGYTGFTSPTGRHGVIQAGYSNCLRAGPCVINGRRQQILEVGMQSAYVSLDAGDRVGDEVVLLGDGLEIGEVATAWRCSAHETTCTLAGMGEKIYL